MSGAYTPAEQAAYAAMQARLVGLLLRYDERRYGQHYGARGQHAADTDAALEPYRELGVLFALRDALFEDILPRIIRHLSFAAPRDTGVEQAPAKGQVNWTRTLDASMASLPGEPPLLLHTRQRRRDFATPENLLAVATLIEYHADAERLLWGEHASVGAEALRHPLNEIAAQCERAMAFPQLAGIREQARQAVEAGALPELEAQVAARLIPGGSAYEDLLAWREQKRGLRLLRRDAEAPPIATLGADPERDNQLYELWIYYELADMLRAQGVLDAWDQKEARLRFRWGGEAYQIGYNHAIPNQPTVWRGGPGVRPDFYMARAEGRREVHDAAGDVVWREPGYVLDAKYHRPPEDDAAAGRHAPTGPIKRMIADLHLTGEQHGALLFAFYGEAQPDAAPVVEPAPNAQRSAPDTRIRLIHLSPALDDQAVAAQLGALLDMVHTALAATPEVRCHGVFLDALSTNAHGAFAQAIAAQSGSPAALADLLVCPKPHVGPWRADIVRLSRDCCQNAAVCHIWNMAGAKKPHRISTMEEISEAIRQSTPDGDDPEAMAQAATAQVRQIVQRYADLIQPDLGEYRAWVRTELDIGDAFDTTPLLSEAQRDTLALGRFLWVQIESIKATNFAGPVLLFTGVLEEITHRTLYAHIRPELSERSGKLLQRTLGTLGKSKDYGGSSWMVIERCIAHGGHWDASASSMGLSTWVDKVLPLSRIRNEAAHRANVGSADFQKLLALYFGGARTGMGVMNGLLLAWR